MEFFNQAITVLQTLVIALGAGLGVWGVINLLEGYGNDNPGAKGMGAWGSCRQRSISWEKITCAPGLAARCRIRSILCSRRDLS